MMKTTSIRARGLCIAVAAALAALSAAPVMAQGAKDPPRDAVPADVRPLPRPAVAPVVKLKAAELARRQTWQKSMDRLQVPRKGCFKSAYPKVAWTEVACTTPPNLPFPPARGPRPQVIGGSNDFAAEVTGLMNGATGSYDSVTGVTSETGQVGGMGPQVANAYSLQLNTRPFTSPVCAASPNPGCQGWQQFLYSSGYGTFIQYWLLRYNTACPAGWTTFQFSGDPDIYCYRNSTGVSMATQPIANLSGLRLTGTATAGGNDTVVMTTSGGDSTVTAVDSVLGLASGWRAVEFILVGDCCGAQANFNAGSSLAVRTTVHNGTTNAPTCVLEGYTGETNNLDLVDTPAIAIGPSPAIVSNQSNSPGGAASCAAAAGVGDTHLTTFRGLMYDFQASGDFLLAETDRHFAVQVRQVSGAPTWPNASVNKAVGIRDGKTTVSICLGERPLKIDGRPVALAQGQVMQLASGGDIVRYGNVYRIRGAGGDSVRVEVNAGWINVKVGLGRWPSKVRGLLADAPGKVGAVAARDGQVMSAPFDFATLYGHYGDSWRVAREDALCDCDGGRIESGDPEKPFQVRDLPPALAKRARLVCIQAGVKAPALLEACTLDVAVLGDKAAAEVFVGGRAPTAVATIVRRRKD
ncbi:VWD domain-containing protein [Caulobacter sp. NIBR1757]|uniref:VWD domain-containing protein n=1 Tax=Caulobacter sp. NIBR1757 TaxID=3016000 RepID=UPI0022F04A67|nr:VWD domain-containing protein [Caulobacter sp. NIBR1757]WGM37699.1 hypothetical protein AMEJIAPC_00599 [Caulobacter sp. NIBR1757]